MPLVAVTVDVPTDSLRDYRCVLCMQTYPNAPRLLENAICLLSNLMYDRDDNKLLICRVCGDEVRRRRAVGHCV